jgi:HK97 family phage portal protein
MTNIFDRLAYGLGRVKGTYLQALKGANAPLGEPSAWGNSSMWGEGLSALAQKPGKKAELAKWFTSWSYICAVTNANARAAVPTSLYVAAAAKGKAWKTIRTRSIDKPRRKYIEARQDLRRFIVKADDVEAVTEHRYIDLMARPNPFLSEADLKYLTSIFMDLSGAAYWYIGVRDKLGIPAQIWVMPSQYVMPIPGKSLKEFVAGYRYERGRVKQDLPVEDVIEFKVPSPLNEYTGMSCLLGVCDAIYINAKINEYVESMFENKARVGGIFMPDITMSAPAIERAREELKEKYTGARKAGMSMMLPPGVKFERDYVTPDEMAYIMGGRVTSEQICIGFGVPKALFDPNAIRANVEGAQYTHAKYGIEPWLMRYDDTLNGDLIPIYDDTGMLFVGSDSPIPEDKAYLLQKRTADMAAGITTINEERADDGKEPVDGGDEPLVSSLLIPLSQAIAEPEPTPAPIIMPPVAGDKPKPGEGDEGNLDTGETGKAAMLDELTRMVEAKMRMRLNGIGDD